MHFITRSGRGAGSHERIGLGLNTTGRVSGGWTNPIPVPGARRMSCSASILRAAPTMTTTGLERDDDSERDVRLQSGS